MIQEHTESGESVGAAPARRDASPLADGLAGAALAAAVWLLYGRVTRLWWTYDDLFLLHLVVGHSPREYFFSPEFWRSFPFKMFMPLLLLSYDTDLAVSGAQPFAFYVHQLLVCSAAAVSLLGVLRKWFGTMLAGAGALLFTLGAPFVAWTQELMHRHYVEGFVLAAMAVWFFVESARSRRWSAGILSALFYFLAMLAKEVYVPLLGVLLLLPEGSLGPRLRRLSPHAIALMVYLAWRRAMIGTFLGGYGWAIRREELPGLILGLPGKVGATLLPASPFWRVLLLGALIAGMVCHFRRPPRAVGLIFGSAVLLLAPLVPVSKAVEPRYGTLLWVLFLAVFLSGCARLARGTLGERAAAPLLLGAAIVAALCSNRARWEIQFREVRRVSEEGRFFLSMSPGDLLRHPRAPAASLNEARWLKEEYLHLPRGSGWFADDIYLCGAGTPAGRIWEYDDSARRVRDVTAATLDAAILFCSGLRLRAPLSATFEASDGALFWNLGPYESGRYCLIRQRGVQSFVVRRRDGYRMSPQTLRLMVRYESPAGWVTYSPELTMDFRTATRFRWERREAAP